MNVRRFALAIVVAFLVSTLFDVVLNAVVLRGPFERAAHYWRAPEELNRLVPLGWLALFLMMSSFGFLFVRARWRGVRRGLEFGAWLALAALFGVAGMATLVPWPLELLSGMAAQQAANGIILGLSLGWLYVDRGGTRSATH